MDQVNKALYITIKSAGKIILEPQSKQNLTNKQKENQWLILYSALYDSMT